jgi:hypothetical protein
MANEVVAHFLNGTMIKGTCLDVDPVRPTCHVKTADKGVLTVKLADLKALYFVKKLEGNPALKETIFLDPGDPRARGANPIELEFKDGEKAAGLTVHYPPTRPFFFVLPADPKSNNLRILVNKAAVAKMSGPGDASGAKPR